MFRRSSYADVAAGTGNSNTSNSGSREGGDRRVSGSFGGASGGRETRGARVGDSRSGADGPGSHQHPSSYGTSHGQAQHAFAGSPHPSFYQAHRHSRPLDNQHNAMYSWARGRQSWPHASDNSMRYGHDSSPPFFVPSYLRGSRHAERVEEAHKLRSAAQRELRSRNASATGALSRSGSSVSLHKMASSYRGLSHDVIERAPPLRSELSSSWPTRWNDDDKYIQLDLEDDGRTAKFSGSQKTHDDAASVRSDHPMPPQCGIYYFEVTVVSKGKDGMIGIGFSGPKVSLSRIPGWEPESYAYHGDDGQIYNSTNAGKTYSDRFGTLDVVGCGINFRTGEAFFTKNGKHLGVAFRDLKAEKLYYPTIGMKKPGEALRANFGQEPFAFDIDKIVQEERTRINQEIMGHREPVYMGLGRPLDETSFIHGLVSQYLAHDGYVETARAFAEEVAEERQALANQASAGNVLSQPEDDVDAINRQKIRMAILGGDIDKALKLTNAYYPSVLRDNTDIYFKLRCRKFIELIRRSFDLSAHINNMVPTPASKRSTASNGHNDEYDFEMELDDQLGNQNQYGWKSSNQNGSNGADHSETMDTEFDDLDAEDLEARHAKLMTETIQYGMELKQEFADDARREVKKALEDTFALIAYENLAESGLAALLDPKGRGPVAEELNGAILVSLGKSPSAAIERLAQQTEALVQELADDGGAGAFVNVGRDYLGVT